MITTNILLYVIPAILMILVTQFTRHMFTRKVEYNTGHGIYWGKKHAICNGVRWLLILVALIPIVNILALCAESCIIAYQITEKEIQARSGNENKFVEWWRK